MAALHDVFICHAFEDKDAIARPLAESLRDSHVEVWFDEFDLQLGDSLRRKIDEGLRSCRYGVVILSPAFFGKGWSEYELDGLVQKDVASAERTILPVWHNVGPAEIRNYSPSLADRVAAQSSSGIAAVVNAILRVVRPIHSPLVIARDLLIEWGHSAPVVTDSFWLDAVEASNRIMPFGPTVPDESAWGRWAFPLPPKDDSPTQWGERIAWAAMQKSWVDEAESARISPITRPDRVHEFILKHPGLFETCEVYPNLLVEYAPQVSMPGFEGPLKRAVEEGYQRASEKNDLEDEWSLRHSFYAKIDAVTIAYEYFHGGIFGPHTSPFEEFDHLVWVYSSGSDWLPSAVKKMLQMGLIGHPIWMNGLHRRLPDHIQDDSITFRTLHDGLPLTAEFWNELEAAVRDSLSLIAVGDNPNIVLARLRDGRVVERSRKARTSRRKTRDKAEKR